RPDHALRLPRAAHVGAPEAHHRRAHPARCRRPPRRLRRQGLVPVPPRADEARHYHRRARRPRRAVPQPDPLHPALAAARGGQGAPRPMSVALVTGAASGNGRAIVGRLLADGLAVAAIDSDADSLERTRRADWGDAGERLLALAGDVSRPEDVAHCTSRTLERLGRLDVLVNNAGINGGPRAPAPHETPAEDDDRRLAGKPRGALPLLPPARPVVLAQGGGRVGTHAPPPPV